MCSVNNRKLLAHNSIRSFKKRLTRLAKPTCFRRFLQHCEDYIEAISKEAEYREAGQVLDMASFEDLRRENSAIRLCFGLFEYALGIDLPDEVFTDSTFMCLYWAAADMVCWSNVSVQKPDLINSSCSPCQDVYSYDMEHSKGLGGNNIITVLQRARGIDLQTASDIVGGYFENLMDLFVGGKKRLPSWGPATDKDVTLYVSAMEHWIIGNLEWSFNTQRYFGPMVAEIKRTRVVTLTPKEKTHE